MSTPRSCLRYAADLADRDCSTVALRPQNRPAGSLTATTRPLFNDRAPCPVPADVRTHRPSPSALRALQRAQAATESAARFELAMREAREQALETLARGGVR